MSSSVISNYIITYYNIFPRNNSLTATSSHITQTTSLSSSTSADHHGLVSIVTDTSIITTSSSIELSPITDVTATSTPVTTVTADNDAASDVTNTASSDDSVVPSASSVQHDGDSRTSHESVPSVLTNSSTSTEGSRDVSSVEDDDTNHNSNNSVNTTEGSSDPVTPTNSSSNNVTVTSHGNNTDDEYVNGEDETFTDALPTQQPPLSTSGQQQQKSSVLIRLSNRIKELEVNMSLFGDYLERVRTRCVLM